MDTSKDGDWLLALSLRKSDIQALWQRDQQSWGILDWLLELDPDQCRVLPQQLRWSDWLFFDSYRSNTISRYLRFVHFAPTTHAGDLRRARRLEFEANEFHKRLSFGHALTGHQRLRNCNTVSNSGCVMQSSRIVWPKNTFQNFKFFPNSRMLGGLCTI